jgi:hypothetical protein
MKYCYHIIIGLMLHNDFLALLFHSDFTLIITLKVWKEEPFQQFVIIQKKSGRNQAKKTL